jgi:hypothetical protein
MLMNQSTLALPIPIDELRDILRDHGVQKAQVFGSYARGEATPESDLDLLVTLAPGRDYLDLGGLQFELSERIPGGVDIATKLNRHFAPYIEKDLIEIL